MKNKFLCTVVALAFLATSCSNQEDGKSIIFQSENQIVVKEANSFDYSKVGDYHNKGLSYFYKSESYNKLSISKSNDFTNLINTSLEEVSNFAVNEGLIEKDELDKIYPSLKFVLNSLHVPNRDKIDDNTYFRHLNDTIKVILLSNGNSQEFTNQLNKVFENVVNKMPREDLISFVENEITSEGWNEEDKRKYKVFHEVLKSSDVYWKSKNKFYKGQDNQKLSGGSYVIAADAAGSIAGMLFGPVGSVLVGAAMSIAENEAQQPYFKK